MFRMMMNSKIHRAQVTQADLNYVGSITIDQNLLDAVGMLPNEKVHIVNNNNGARFETYIIAGERGSRRDLCERRSSSPCAKRGCRYNYFVCVCRQQ